MEEILKIHPYARLLTMLGDQLIKNEVIALVELIKNSYDADADWVKIHLKNFGDNYEHSPESQIIIEDNGTGMTLDTIKNAWMNPATPNKLSIDGKILKTDKGRFIQGEKGIGRYAILKLGKKIKIITKPESSDKEFVIDFDLSKYDNDFLTINGKKEELFIEDIPIKIYSQKRTKIINREIIVGSKRYPNRNSGTRIEISDLKSNWSEEKLKKVNNDIIKLQPIFSKLFNKKEKYEFNISFYVNSKKKSFSELNLEKLNNLLEKRAVLKVINGKFDNKNLFFKFNINNLSKTITLSDPLIRGLKVFKDRFYNKATKIYYNPNCGNFEFNFYIFDFSSEAPLKYLLDNKEDKPILKEHRVYLYRDGIRVYPYGDPDNDWLKIDTLRGTYSAGAFFSNNDIVGWIDISKDGNPKLKDKTNREGLIEEGNITDDFIALIQSLLSYLKQHPFQQYKESIKDRKVQDFYKQNKLDIEFSNLRIQCKSDNKALKIINLAEKVYKLEKNYLEQRVRATEELASVGLSVETASHDIMLMFSQGLNSLDHLIKDCLNDIIDKKEIIEELNKLRGMFSFVETQMKDIQLLFKSSKQKVKNIRVKDLLEKVIHIYKRTLKEFNITYEIKSDIVPVIAKCTDAVLLQLFINLFDNSIYWLSTIEKEGKQIIITFNDQENKLIFSDNGPGVNEDDAPYIFEAFFSGKGEEGRGLGLYIARQLLERFDYSIELAVLKSDKILSGANFVVSFIKSEA